MASATARGGGRGSGLSGLVPRRSFFTYRMFFPAVSFSFIFIATLSVIFFAYHYTYSYDRDLPRIPPIRRTFLALKMDDPSKTRLYSIHKQARDHITLVNAYAAYARKWKLENSRQLRTFNDLAQNFTDLVSSPAYKDALFQSGGSQVMINETLLRQFEKELKDKAKTLRLLIAEAKEAYDSQMKIQKLKDTVFAVQESLVKARRDDDYARLVVARSVPRSLHCLGMRLVEEMVKHPEKYYRPEDGGGAPKPEFEDPGLYHYAVFSDNVIAVSVVLSSAVKNAEEPWKHVFHVVTDRKNLAAMKVWFTERPARGGAHVEVKVVEEFTVVMRQPVVRHQPAAKLRTHLYSENATTTEHTSMLNHLRFYLPEMYPKLHRILLLDDDVVVQKDLTALWSIDLDGKVHGAVETCFGSFHRYAQYLNFSNPLIKERFDPMACAWAYGMNMFDLDAWRREKCTEEYRYWQSLQNEDRTLWKLGTVHPPGLITFYSKTKPLERSWHVMGLGYNPGVSVDAIKDAAVIHYDGNMKPWLDIALSQYKDLWTKYVDTEMESVRMCNFGF